MRDDSICFPTRIQALYFPTIECYIGFRLPRGLWNLICSFSFVSRSVSRFLPHLGSYLLLVLPIAKGLT